MLFLFQLIQIFIHEMGMRPSGNLTWLWKFIIFNGKVHYFYGDFPVRYVTVITRGYNPCIAM